jgi:hypothetical protein
MTAPTLEEGSHHPMTATIIEEGPRTGMTTTTTKICNGPSVHLVMKLGRTTLGTLPGLDRCVHQATRGLVPPPHHNLESTLP